MVAVERTVVQGSSVIPEFPGVASDLQNYILTAREVFQRQGAIDFSTMSLVQIRDQLLTRPEVEEAFGVVRGMGAGEFFQLMLDRGVLNPKDDQSRLYLDQVGMDAFSVLRFWYRRRVLTYGPSVAAKTVTALYDAAYSSIRTVASIANYIDYPFPAPKPEKPKPSSSSPVDAVSDTASLEDSTLLLVSFTPPKPGSSKPWSFGEGGSTVLSKRRAAPPPTPLPDPIRPVPGGTIAQRWRFIAERQKEQDDPRKGRTGEGNKSVGNSWGELRNNPQGRAKANKKPPKVRTW